MKTWGFLTNHAHVLIQIARDPNSKVREIAVAAGITERAAHGVLQDLRRADIIHTRRDGRRNVNQLNAAALADHRPWGASDMEIPQSLIDATIHGLARVTTNGSFLPPGHRPSAHGAKEDSLHRWGFLTNHALILIHVTQHPRSTVREIAQAVGLTERATYSTLLDLRESGIVERQREGNRNRHSLNFEELAAYRREGTAPGLVPSDFVSDLMVALLPLRPAV